MLGCLNSGISGLNANNNNMSVIANNIANVNTPGYKVQRANFADILSQESGNLAAGNGVNITDVSSIQTQGSFESTNNATDLAVDGAGLFIAKDDEGATYYTRAGQFHFNNEGKLVTTDGYTVQGWNLRENETMSGLPVDIDISNVSLPPKATENLSVAVNLDSNAETFDPVATPFDATDSETYNYTTSVSVFDSLGNSHNITFYFQKTAQNEWGWHAVSNNGIEQASNVQSCHECPSFIFDEALGILPDWISLHHCYGPPSRNLQY